LLFGRQPTRFSLLLRERLQLRFPLVAFTLYQLARAFPMRLGLAFGATLCLPKLISTMANTFFEVVHMSHSVAVQHHNRELGL
jgi:hypothetical protein